MMSDSGTQQPLIPAPVLRAPEPPAHNILVGPLGLRAGWGMLLFAVLLTLVVALAFRATTASSPLLRQEFRVAREAQIAAKRPGPHPAFVASRLMTFAQEADGTAACMLAAFALCLIEHRRFGVYGLTPRYLRDLLPGALTGLLAMAAMIFLLWSLNLLIFDRQLMHGATAFNYGLTWLLIFALVGLFEEFLFRGYLQFTLMRGVLGLARHLAPGKQRLVAFWISAVFWSLVFFASHGFNAGETAPGLAAVFLAGILFAYALWRTGSLWWGIGFHTTWDWSQSFLYGVPDSGALSMGRLFQTHPAGNRLLSGGADGPEGSALVLLILALVFLVLRQHTQRPQPAVEPTGNTGFTDLPAPIA